ncbi:winged helix-turn-helix domain-containing protein [Cedecea sp. P7760]|uniref:winged helix-turn-helix domain-containing protein n=1 Tax=Cedecea sp. P7760 TaxID=2726983 RepID=UPI0015A11040|nr:winged helix-turn-helix domain-containing protein [Cedecea sp. P7760]NWC66031.1 winged helix-turn-helix domain-containing protein [Cedecea sp. P7760]
MNSENQQKVISFLQENKRATARQLAKVLGRDSTGAWNILMHLLRKGIIKRCGTAAFPEIKLAQGWESKVCRRKNPSRHQRVKPAVADVCRKNWLGYGIHKIFGSAGK